jgi:hypothetical protein
VRIFFIYLLSVTVSCHLSAQNTAPKAPYLLNRTIPSFTLLNVDSSTYLTNKNLTRNKKTLIVYFSPDCDHCQHQTDSILLKINRFKNIQILMATYQPLHELKAFNQRYALSRYNIKFGRDVNFFFPPHYKIVNLPFLILYNEKGNLITTFEGITQVDKVLKAFANPT